MKKSYIEQIKQIHQQNFVKNKILLTSSKKPVTITELSKACKIAYKNIHANIKNLEKNHLIKVIKTEEKHNPSFIISLAYIIDTNNLTDIIDFIKNNEKFIEQRSCEIHTDFLNSIPLNTKESFSSESSNKEKIIIEDIKMIPLTGKERFIFYAKLNDLYAKKIFDEYKKGRI